MLSEVWEKLSSPDFKAETNNLLFGSVGKTHLAQTARGFLRARKSTPQEKTFCRELGRDMLLAAWEEDFLDGPSAARVLEEHQKHPWLNKTVLDALHAVAANWQQPKDLRYFSRLARRREYAKITSYLVAQTTKEPHNLFWRQKALAHAAAIQDRETASLALKGPWPKELLFARDCIQAHILLQDQDPEQAATLLGQAAKQVPLQGILEKEAEARFRMQDAENALMLRRNVIRARPWHTNLILRVHDTLNGLDRKKTTLPGQTAILLYTHNKAPDLEKTLTSLFQSRLGDSRVYVLDNGSTDHTPEILKARQKREGKRLSIVTLPVNIGAPSARNWLLHLPEVSGSDWCAYLDDDVELPQDWLLKLGAAADTYPRAGVWGCKVCEFFTPQVMQNADLHILWEHGQEPNPNNPETAPVFTTSNLHLQVLDFGQFDYLRPCASVTGCCHLFQTRTLLESGDFSLHLSPSQYDDLEHDLRLGLMRKGAVYQGHLRVKHMKKTGKTGLTERQDYGNAMANKHKVRAMHPPDEIEKIMSWERETLAGDLAAKVKLVAKEL